MKIDNILADGTSLYSSKEILHAERKITLRSKILSGRVGEREGALASSLSHVLATALAPSTSDR